MTLTSPVLAVLLLCVCGTAASAQCRMATTGAGCAIAPVKSAALPKPIPPQPVEIGQIIARGDYSMVMDARWYGLPPARDGWIYYRIADEVYRVDYRTMEVLERATDEAAANWP